MQGREFGNALRAASIGGHENIVELLLWKGDIRGIIHRPREGSRALLLAEGADASAQVGYFDNTLQAASFAGHEKVVELLLYLGSLPANLW